MSTVPTVTVEQVTAVLGDLLRTQAAAVHAPTKFTPDAVGVTIDAYTGSVHSYGARVDRLAEALRAAGFHVQIERNNLYVRTAYEGQLTVRTAILKTHRGRTYRARGDWDLFDATGTKVGRVWRQASPDSKVYRVEVTGLPENPREYPTRGAAVAAAERALLATKKG